MKKSEIKNSAELFYYKATVDFSVAKTLLRAINNGEANIDMDAVFFHLQQTVEKLLKSLISYKKIRVDKTHDIESLIVCCVQNQIELLDNTDSLCALSEFAVEGRYALIHDDLENTDGHIELIGHFIEFVEKRITA